MFKKKAFPGFLGMLSFLVFCDPKELCPDNVISGQSTYCHSTDLGTGCPNPDLNLIHFKKRFFSQYYFWYSSDDS